MNNLLNECQQHLDVLQKWEQPFQSLLDEIYWHGYAEDLLKSNPEEYSREYFYFMALYD